MTKTVLKLGWIAWEALPRSARQAWSAAGIAGLLAAGVVRADPVLDWNALMLDAIRVDNSGPTLSTRNLAILGVALYDTINSVHPTYQPYVSLVQPETGVRAEMAAAAAGHLVVSQLYPGFRARADALLAQAVAAMPAGADRDASVRFGTRVATQVLASREADGANTNIPYIPSNDPGQWRRTPPLYRPPLTPHWRLVEPFGIPDPARFRPPPPPALDSPEYAAAVNEVKALGARNSTVRTAEQTEIAQFWSDFSYTVMPPGHFHQIAATIAGGEGLPLLETARLFALLGIAQADAAIVCWDTKYAYNLWRPVTAIRRADEDGNPETEADPAWDALLAAPPFPEYTSGHSTFARTAATVISWFFGRDDLTFKAQSDTLPGVYRNFTSLSACAEEVGMSRIYGGIHFMFANLAGRQSGDAVAKYVIQNYLLKRDGLPDLLCEPGEPGKLHMRLHGWPGVSYEIDVASDLRTWTRVTQLEARPGGAEFLVETRADMPTRFFRAVELAVEGE